mmetsp:Transcript_19351/g.24676  ORF Transcript_19351/g.24676 Transcript_19351/m.24676 type:complete len:120 (-) Transcript_19351:168-527(-)
MSRVNRETVHLSSFFLKNECTPARGCTTSAADTLDFLGAFAFANDVVFVRLTDIKRLFCCNECFLDRVLSKISIALLLFGTLSFDLDLGGGNAAKSNDEVVVDADVDTDVICLEVLIAC